MNKLKKNEVYEIEITGLTSEGSGVGRIDGIAVFVPFSAIGDHLKILIVKVKKTFAYGKILEVLEPSPDRIVADCPVFGRCGGCVYRHLSYEAELEAKKLVVQNNIRRIGGFEDFKVEPVLSDNVRTLGYRNKAQYPFGIVNEKPAAGFYSPRSHRITPCTNCALQPPEFEKILDYTLEFLEQNKISIYDERAHSGLWRHLFVRKAKQTGEIMVMPVINGAALPHQDEYTKGLRRILGESLISVMLNFNTEDTNVILGTECRCLYGQDYITDELCGVKVRISALSFYQVNRDMAERLYLKAAEYAEPEGKVVLDLYCGAGTIGLSMAKSAEKIIGVEIIPDAVEDAKINAHENGTQNAEFICADAAKAAEILAKRNLHPDAVIVDPPRKGCDEKLLNIIAHDFAPERIVYVSCDSATLSRDLKYLASNGYALIEATPCDLFPGTEHVECCALLCRAR